MINFFFFECNFLLLIFGIFNTKVSSNTFHSILVVWKDSLAGRSTTFTEWNYTFLKSTPPELLNDQSHDAESELCQKLTIDSFPGTLWIGNISETINAWKCKKYFSGPTFKSQSIDISI